MNAPRDIPAAATAPPLHRIALALLAPVASEAASTPEAAWLSNVARGLPATPIARWQANPPAGDAALSALGVELGLEAIEVVAASIVAAVEFEPMLARVLAWLQAPVACARPTLGLLDRLGELLGVPETLATLLAGRALASGLLRVDDDAGRPMPERALHMPLPLALALRGRSSGWPGTRRLEAVADVPATLQSAAARAANGLRDGASGELGSLAQLVRDAVDDDALVAPPELHEALRALEHRCLRRDGLADALGPAARTRYRPGVRALFVGASGTGKTLAGAWLATRLGLPLYRVDLAAVSSKYIGETEKNLAQLFARAEHAEVVLLFDEADSLFGKRTEVKEANDRFANQQTNYLLQRIESFDGIALLTSNSRARFDSAFTRRLDAIIEFPSPGPQARRDLWLAHLGAHHTLDAAQLNRVAALCDLAGGHIRSATLAAAAGADGPVDDAGLRAAIATEYRKLGRQVPAGL